MAKQCLYLGLGVSQDLICELGKLLLDHDQVRKGAGVNLRASGAAGSLQEQIQFTYHTHAVLITVGLNLVIGCNRSVPDLHLSSKVDLGNLMVCIAAAFS
jgi:hypothetical protein